MHNDGEAEVGGQALCDRAPSVAMVVTAQDADARSRPAGPVPIRPAPMVLHVEPARRVLVTRHLVNALAEFGVRIGRETGADAFVGRGEGRAPILAQIMTPGRDAEVNPISIAEDCVHAKSSVAGIPFTRVLVIANAANQFPGIAAVAASEQRRWLDAAPKLLLFHTGLNGPNVGQRAAIIFWEGGGRLRFLEGLAQVRRAENFHAEKRVATRSIDPRCAAGIEQGGVHGHAGAKRAAQSEPSSSL